MDKEERNGSFDYRALTETLEELHSMAVENTKAVGGLTDILESKLDKLIDVVAGKGMIPVDVFRWLIIFICIFVFAMEFGVKGVTEILHSAGK